MVVIKEDHFDYYTCPDTYKTLSIRRFTIENTNKVSVQVITYGATVTSIKCPDRRGIVKDVVAGFSNMSGYLNSTNPSFGSTIGRAANYIGGAQFKCLDEVAELSKNANRHHFNGGFVGFDQVIWESYVEDGMLVLSYNSPDQEEGYPGNLVVNILFELTESNEFTIHYKARTTKATCVNLTNYIHFNLAGFYIGPSAILQHCLCLRADKVVELANDGVPTGNLLPVVDTVLDFQIPKQLGPSMRTLDGLDHILAITKSLDKDNTFIASLYYPDNGRSIEISSNQESIHLYTPNGLPERRKYEKRQVGDVRVVSGKGYNYYKQGSICIAPQNYPDSPNHDNFPDSIYIPGEDYYKFIKYKFVTKK